MSVYEYKTVELRDFPGLVPPVLMEDQLNKQAEEGWRLAVVLEKQWPPKAILEREVQVREGDRTLEDRDVSGPPS